MPNLGATELIIILVIIILVFGVGKLPEVGQALGKGIREFRGAAEADDDKADDAPRSAAAAAPVVEAPRPMGAVEAPHVQPSVVPAATAATTHASVPVSGASVAAPTVAGPSVSGSSVAAPTVAASAPATIAYTVQTGDTLDVIAERHGVSIDAVMEANGYSQRDRVLYPGDKIQVPTATARA